MKIIICLVKDDIKTSSYGNNFGIEANGIDINLTREAAEELLNDLKLLLNTETESQ